MRFMAYHIYQLPEADSLLLSLFQAARLRKKHHGLKHFTDRVNSREEPRENVHPEQEWLQYSSTVFLL